MNNLITEAEGTVVHGNHIGRTIGIPTINIFPAEDTSHLLRGVYFSTITFLDGPRIGETFNGITNVGRKPTVQNTDVVNFETHIFDFDDDVYGCRVLIKLIKFSRPEAKFDSIAALTSQIQSDIRNGRDFFIKQIVK